MSDNIPMLKSLQYLIICKAGLAVCEEIEASTEELRREILREFTEGVEKITLPIELKGYDKEVFLRSKNFASRACTFSDLHTGMSKENCFFFDGNKWQI